MNIFSVHEQIAEHYKEYIHSFVNIEDERIGKMVRENLNEDVLCPPPMIQFNPNFKFGQAIENLTGELNLHPHIGKIFRGYKLYQHQEDAIRSYQHKKPFVVTSGTGSGKSLTYLANIFDYVLKNPEKGIKAILVYPMNALINSQDDELRKFDENCKKYTTEFGISYKKYTGQEGEKERIEVRDQLPDILLTNYMMLELLMTRENETEIRASLSKSLKFLVFDELHTYKGRQGADVALLIRRIKANSKLDLFCIGTSATMSGGKGNIKSQKDEVAQFATKIFGQNFNAENIITETIEPITEAPDSNVTISLFSNIIERGVNFQEDEEALKNNEIVKWIEHEIGLRKEGDTYLRNSICTIQELATKLHLKSGILVERCKNYIYDLLNWTNQINENKKRRGERGTYLPFKLHQFISQTGGVFVSLESRTEREITLAPGYYKNVNNESKVKIYPVVFSRLTGKEFICVKRDMARSLLLPRGFRDIDETDESDDDLTGKDFNSGYILLEDNPDESIVWNENKINDLPDSWFKGNNKEGIKIHNDKKNRLPTLIFFDKYGHFRDQRFEGSIPGWYMPAKLAFDPTCMAFYDLKTSEGSKLTGLGNEGRSTATTTLTLAVLEALKKNGVTRENLKLLSFTDNRQDASLQSGHFNDLVNVAVIRSALYKALQNNNEDSLDITNIAGEVFNVLDLKQEEYALQPATSRFSTDNERCLKDFITLRLLQDLKRGWRYVLPNLENCALLDIDYKYLREETANSENWDNIPYLGFLTHNEKYQFIKNTLDYIRTSKAIYHSIFYENKDTLENNIRERLREEWGFERGEKIETPYIVRYETVGKNVSEPTVSMGSRSQWGQYVKGIIPFDNTVATFDEFCQALFTTLTNMQYLRARQVKGEKGTATAYLLNSTAILWKKGDGIRVKADPVRIRSNSDIYFKPNKYFKNIYENAIENYKHINASEHTGQIENLIRKEREENFKNGKINTLFCSPTMELGIDIKDLSIVHMRNVPPSPANYAQRSGRAGRSGQSALVITYCSQYSPHDRNYFKKKDQMVSGVVIPPRIDISNNELIRAHVNAVYLMVAGLNIGNSMKEVVDLDSPGLEIKQELRKKLTEGHAVRKPVVLEIVQKILHYTEETKKDSHLTEIWIDQFQTELENSLDRWRKLYRQAKEMIQESRMVKDNPVYGAKSSERLKAVKDEKFAFNLLDRLLNDETAGRGNSLSEFYPYRYLASEGFLPGYNFTKLPNRVMLRKGDNAEFIERPRLIAISEFGPRNMIYHNGTTYEVNRIIYDTNKLAVTDAKVSKDTGYIMMGDEYFRETCPISKKPLSGQQDCIISNIIPHGFSEANARKKINCEEEERRRLGYKTQTFFYQPAGTETSTHLKIMGGENDHLLDFTYMPTAKIVVINHKWIRSVNDGFKIDSNTGFWKKESDAEKDKDGSITSVKLMTDYTADALYIQPMQVLNLDRNGIITFQYALKRALEEVFQIESNEIAVINIGNESKPNILVYESTEGSLGILKDIANDISLFHKVIEKTYEICHFHNGKDIRPESGPASYDDLLTYYNQRDHEIIDRYLIQSALEKLMQCKPEVKPKHFESYQAQYETLIQKADPQSELELRFLKFLYKNNLRLPDGAQQSLVHLDLFVKPDFHYDQRVFVFCDGSVHDQEEVMKSDLTKRNALRRRGIRFIEVKYAESMDSLIQQNKDIFTKIKEE